MNKVMLIGNVGKDPLVRYYDADQAVAQGSFATSERSYTLPNGTVVPERTEWHNLVFYKKLAKYIESYVHKGDKLYVEGKIRYRSYDDKAGRKHYVTEIVVDTMEMLSYRGMSANADSSGTPATENVSRQKQETTDAGEQESDNELPF